MQHIMHLWDHRPTMAIGATLRHSLIAVTCFLIGCLTVLIHCAAAQSAPAQPIKPFPAPDLILKDAKHQEPKSGVQLQGGQLTITSGVGTPSAINALSFSADGNTLAAAKDFGRVVVWNVREKKIVRVLETGQGTIDAVAANPDGGTVASGGKGDEFSVKIWDIRTGKILKELRNGNSAITALAYDATGQSLIVRYNAGVLRVFNVSTWEPALTINQVRAASLSQDRKTLSTVDDKDITAWDCSSRSKIKSKPAWKGLPLVLAADPAGDKLAVYGQRSLRIVHGDTGEVVIGRTDFFPKNFTWRPEFAEFNVDASVLFSSIDGHLWIWQLTNNQVCSSPVMYSGAGTLSPDGRWFAGSKDDSIMSTERTDGVWIWETSRLTKACSLN